MGMFDGLFDFFSGTSNSSEQQTVNTTKNEDVRQTSLGSKSGATTAESGKAGSSLQTLDLLDSGSRQALSGLIQTLTNSNIIGAAGEAPDLGTTRDFANFLATRAKSGDASSDTEIADILSAARATGEQNIGRQNTKLAGQAGSAFNSVVQKAGQESVADLEVQLAGLGGQLGLEADKLKSQDLVSAFAALNELTKTGQAVSSDTIGDIAKLGDVLKGSSGTVSVASEEQSVTNQLQSIIEAMEQFKEGTSVTTGSSSGTSSSGSSIIDFLSVPGVLTN